LLKKRTNGSVRYCQYTSHWFLIIRPVMTQKKTPENRFMRTGVVAQTALPSVTAKPAMVRQDSERTEVNRGIREAWSGSKYVAVS
ncbi:hypothetical protein ACTJ43_003975, partial [Escherichia coli]